MTVSLYTAALKKGEVGFSRLLVLSFAFCACYVCLVQRTTSFTIFSFFSCFFPNGNIFIPSYAINLLIA